MSVLAYSRACHNAQPFSGQGASLYVTVGSSVQYRRYLTGGRRKVLRQGWSGRNAKTLRVDSDTGVADDQIDFSYSLPATLASQTVTVDVRHYKDDVENLSYNYLTETIELDSSRDPVPAVYGSAVWIEPEIRAGGIVRLAWTWIPVDYGTQPTRFRIVFTAGPTSPSDITTTVTTGLNDYTVDTLALSDSSAYTVRLEAETDTVTTILASGKTFTADATGPAQPTLVSISAR